MGREVDMQSIGGFKEHGLGGQYTMGKGLKYHG